jgi:hypothetical protein
MNQTITITITITDLMNYLSLKTTKVSDDPKMIWDGMLAECVADSSGAHQLDGYTDTLIESVLENVLWGSNYKGDLIEEDDE